jgi:hypothetical protein
MFRRWRRFGLLLVRPQKNGLLRSLESRALGQLVRRAGAGGLFEFSAPGVGGSDRKDAVRQRGGPFVRLRLLATQTMQQPRVGHWWEAPAVSSLLNYLFASARRSRLGVERLDCLPESTLTASFVGHDGCSFSA